MTKEIQNLTFNKQESEPCNVSVYFDTFCLKFENCKIIHDGGFIRILDSKGECVIPIKSISYYEKHKPGQESQYDIKVLNKKGEE
jgi:hypothetical protein